jgi:hypothetical protein
MKVSTARFSELHALDKHKEFGIATKLKPPSSRHTKYPVSSNMASEIFTTKNGGLSRKISYQWAIMYFALPRLITSRHI